MCPLPPKSLGFLLLQELLWLPGSPPLPGGWSQRACLAKELCSRGEQRRLQDFSLGRG